MRQTKNHVKSGHDNDTQTTNSLAVCFLPMGPMNEFGRCYPVVTAPESSGTVCFLDCNVVRAEMMISLLQKMDSHFLICVFSVLWFCEI